MINPDTTQHKTKTPDKTIVSAKIETLPSTKKKKKTLNLASYPKDNEFRLWQPAQRNKFQRQDPSVIKPNMLGYFNFSDKFTEPPS